MDGMWMAILTGLFVYCNSQVRTHPEVLALYRRPSVGIGDNILAPQFALQVAGLVMIGQQRDHRLIAALLMLSMLLGAYGLGRRFLEGPRMESFFGYGLGEFLAWAVVCTFMAAAFFVAAIIGAIVTILMWIAGEYRWGSWDLCAGLLIEAFLSVKAIFVPLLRDRPIFGND